MNGKQCKELRRAIVEKYPQYKDYDKLKVSTQQERQIYKQYRKLYQSAKIQFKSTPRNERNIIIIT